MLKDKTPLKFTCKVCDYKDHKIDSRFPTFFPLFGTYVNPWLDLGQIRQPTFLKKHAATLFTSVESISGQSPTTSTVLGRDNTDNRSGIYNKHVYCMSAKTHASFQHKPHDGPQKATPSVFILLKNHPSAHAQCYTSLFLPLIRPKRGREKATLGFLASGVERSSCFEPSLWLKTGHA